MFATSFESEERSFKNRKTTIAAFVTIAIHSLILLFLIWMILTPPDPPYTDSAGGVSVNFGTDEAGSGDIQPMSLTPIEANFTPQPSASSQQTSQNEEDVTTQDLEEAPVMKKETAKVSKKKPVENVVVKAKSNSNTVNEKANIKSEVVAPSAPKADPNAMFKKGTYGNPNNIKGDDGTGGGQGDQGKPDGDPNSKSYLDGEGGTKSGVGKGSNINLKGRTIVNRATTKSCNEKGIVIVDITVDRSGNVVNAKPHMTGSTLIGGCSVENALKSARAYKFNSDSQAEEFQYGSITYVFTVQ